MPSKKAMKAAESYHKWMIRTPVISRDDPQEMRLAKAFDQHAAEARKDQAEKCAMAIDKFADEHFLGYELDLAIKLIEVCLNAVEREDE